MDGPPGGVPRAAPDAETNPATKEPVEKATFSKLFNKEVHSWGKNNFISIRGMQSGAYCVNDTIMIGAEISSVKEVAHDIEDWGIMPNGEYTRITNMKSPRQS